MVTLHRRCYGSSFCVGYYSSLPVGSFVNTHIFLQIRFMHAGVHDSLFVAGNVGDFDYLYMALGRLQR